MLFTVSEADSDDGTLAPTDHNIGSAPHSTTRPCVASVPPMLGAVWRRLAMLAATVFVVLAASSSLAWARSASRPAAETQEFAYHAASRLLAKASLVNAITEHAILRAKVHNRLQLVPVQPPGDEQDHKVKTRESKHARRVFTASLLCERAIAQRHDSALVNEEQSLSRDIRSTWRGLRGLRRRRDPEGVPRHACFE